MKYSTLLAISLIAGFFPGIVLAQTATDLICVRCVSTSDLAINAVVSSIIRDGTITDADISTTTAINPSKISGTAWTGSNDGVGSGLQADWLDGLDSSQLLRSDQSGIFLGNLQIYSADSGNLQLSTTSTFGPAITLGGSTSFKWLATNSGDAQGSDKLVLSNVGGGSDLVTVSAMGNVGIGTTSPASLLDISGQTTQGSFTIKSASYSGAFMRLERYGSGNFFDIETGAANNDTLAFHRGSSPYADLVIGGNGYIGIGTQTPTDPLTIDAGTNDAIAMLSDTNNDWYLGPNVGSGTGFGIYDGDNAALRLKIDTAGNVGIGTTEPAEKLAVQGNIVATGSICGSAGCVGSSSSSSDANTLDGLDSSQFVRNDTSGSINGNLTLSNTLYGPDGSSLTLQSAGSRAMVFNTDGATERMRLTSDGYVGIGTASPTATATVSSTASANLLRVNDDGDGDTTPFYISGGGRVGIGTTDNDGNKVHMVWDESGGTTLYVENTASNASNTTGIQGVVYADGDGSGQPIGVRGDAENDSPVEGQYGVLGYNWATNQTSGLQGAGVFGGSVGIPGSEGNYTGRGHGIQGETYASNTNSAGGIFYSNNNDDTNGLADAIRGITSSENANSYSLLGEGPTASTGTKSAIVNTASQGPTELYVVESPEIWFEDIGEGKLINGRVTVQLDPLFTETITVDQTHPLQVFVQPYANVELYVERGTTSFTVVAKDNIDSSASFAYRVLAKRKHYENQRLRKTDVPIDQFMEPDLTVDQLIEINKKWGLDEAYKEVFLNHTPTVSATNSTAETDTIQLQ